MDSCLGPADTGGFSALACRDRWLALQRLRAKANLDAVLIIVGPDAQFGRGAEALFNWLLCGVGGREVLTACLDSEFEECVVCIRATRSTIFCKRAVHDKIAALTSLWESLEIVVPTKEEEVDQDLYDTRKVGAFIEMVTSCKSLGVVVRGTDIHVGDVKMTVERWPLVQAYAYDEYGHGFMTMKKTVLNLEEILQTQLYTCWDLHTVLWAADLTAQLCKAWEGALLVQDKHAARRDPADQPDVAMAPLVDFFEYGRLTLTDEEILEWRGAASTSNGDAAAGDMPIPRLLIGPSQSMQILSAGSAAPEVPPGDALHAIWEAVDPVAGIAATRTYGFQTGLHAHGHVGPQLQMLFQAYTAAASCCHHLLQGPLASVAFSPRRALQVSELATSFMQSRFPDVPGVLNTHCILLDTMGFPAIPEQSGSGIALVFLRIVISGIQCPNTGSQLGAVAYGDSVFCTAMNPLYAEATHSDVLTDTLPIFASWLSPVENELSKAVKAGLDSNFGVGMSPGRFVALGHRPGMRVPVDPPETPPDPLELGSVIDTEFRASLAIDVGIHAGSELPIAALTPGVAWTFSSGKLVFSSERTGYILLQVLQSPEGIPSFEAAAGLMWVPAAVAATADMPGFAALGGSRLAVTITPMSMTQWRGDQETRDVDNSHLQWLSSLVKHTSSSPQLTDQLLSRVALCGAYCGDMPATTLNALMQNSIATIASAGTCRVIWVTGLPGSGVLDVAEPLARVLGAPLIDLAAVVPIGNNLVMSDDGSAIIAPLTQALKGHASTCSVVVVCDVLCTPAGVLAGLANHKEFADSFQATHTISVLDPLITYPWKSMRHPMALSRSHRGWVTVNVLQDYRPAPSGIGIREWNPLATRLQRELKACRGGGHVLKKPPTGSLIDGPLQEAPASAALRGLALPGSVLPGDACPTSVSFCHPSDQLLGIFVPMSAPIDLGTVREQCLNALETAVQVACPLAGEPWASAWRGLFCVEAHVCGADARLLWALEPSELQERFRAGTAFVAERFVLCTRGEIPIPQHWTAPLANSMGFIWWWCIPKAAGSDFSLWRTEAERVVDNCRLRPPAAEAMWTRSDVPQEQLVHLEEEAREMGLPDGCFFNGVHYVDVDGNETREHPGLWRLLDAFLAKHNAEVQARSAIVQEMAVLPIFSA